ncbi:MAG TPA: alanine racemase [Planctomycetota bacterium]
MDSTRAWAEIDLDALARNLALVRRLIGPSVAIFLVAKADAYGHGSTAVAHHALHSGAQAICVTTCGEALQLRRAGVRARIIVLGPTLGDESLPALRQGIEVAVPSLELFRSLERTALGTATQARIHLKVDTGMNRLGMTPSEALSALESLRSGPFLVLAGLMTHVAATDGARSESARVQARDFDALLGEARSLGLLAGPSGRCAAHLANSASVLSGLAPLQDAVRVGAAAYGLAPDPRLFHPELAPVMSVRTRIVHMQELRTGEHVGYGGTWEARRASRIAVLPVGYDDGVDWRLSNQGEVLVRGRRVPIVGRISMDYTTVDVTDVPGLALGERVTLLGADGGARIRAEEIAARTGTVPYDVTCSIGKRVERIFVGGGAVPGAVGAARRALPG